MTIVNSPGTCENSIDIGIGNQLLYFGRINNFAIKTNQLAYAGNTMKPLDFSGLISESNTPAAMPADVLTRQFFQLRIQIDPIIMNFRHVVVSDKTRTLTRSMPGRSRSKFTFLNEQAVCPAFLSKVKCECRTHDAATNDDDFCLGRKGFFVHFIFSYEYLLVNSNNSDSDRRTHSAS